jgi:hypothetical protein
MVIRKKNTQVQYEIEKNKNGWWILFRLGSNYFFWIKKALRKENQIENSGRNVIGFIYLFPEHLLP